MFICRIWYLGVHFYMISTLCLTFFIIKMVGAVGRTHSGCTHMLAYALPPNALAPPPIGYAKEGRSGLHNGAERNASSIRASDARLLESRALWLFYSVLLGSVGGWVSFKPGTTLSGGEEILLSSKMPTHPFLYEFGFTPTSQWSGDSRRGNVWMGAQVGARCG